MLGVCDGRARGRALFGAVAVQHKRVTETGNICWALAKLFQNQGQHVKIVRDGLFEADALFEAVAAQQVRIAKSGDVQHMST